MEELSRKELEEYYADNLARYNSLVNAVQKLELDNGALVQENAMLKEQIENADLNIAQQKATLLNVVTNSNKQKDDMATEIALLKQGS